MTKDREAAKVHSREDERIRWFRIIVFAGFALFCPLIAGAVWARPAQLVLLGLILWLNPPRRSLPPPVNWMLVALLLLAAVVYLPAGWFGSVPWRESALRSGIVLGGSLTPQPWLTLEGIFDLVVGISWGYLLFAQKWSLREHRLLAQLFAGGVLVLIILAIWVKQSDASIPFWRNERNFGPFENRNNTADLFAIGGIMMLGCAYAALRRSKVAALLWCAAAVVAVFGVVFSYSRAGVLLLIAGALVWVLILAFSTRDRVPIAIFAAVGISLGTLFLIKGGDTLERFKLQDNAGEVLLKDFRWLLYKDVFAMSADSPWCGVGLGNFGDVFPQYRKASRTEARAPHPDSDWAMLYAEMGLASVFLVAGCATLMMFTARPLRHRTNLSIRAAALTGVVCFAIHGFANISGHVLGTVVPALLVASLAVAPGAQLPYRKSVGTTFRMAGICVATFGAGSTLMFWGYDAVPGRTAIAQFKKESHRLYSLGRWNELERIASRGIQIAPLDWEFYYLRGAAAALGRNATNLAVNDFRRARYLYPNSWRIAFQQGLIFIRVQPQLAVEPWEHALNNAADVPPELFRRMLEASQSQPDLQRALRRFALGNVDRQLATLQQQSGKEFADSLRGIRERDPGLERLTAAQKERLLTAWASRDQQGLLQEMERYPTWRPFIWTVVANDLAAGGRFQQAYQTAIEHVASPALPRSENVRPLEELERQFVINKQDVEIGFRLYQAQQAAGLAENARATLDALATAPNCPPYVYYLQAQSYAGSGGWREAWAALCMYDKRLQNPQRQAA